MNDTIVGILLVLGGLLSVVSAVEDWDWYMDSRKARRLSKLIGRNNARIFYGILGTGLILAGMMMFFSFIVLE